MSAFRFQIHCKKLKFCLLLVLMALIGCDESEENEEAEPIRILKAEVDGNAIDFSDGAGDDFAFAQAIITDDRKLEIQGTSNLSLRLTIGETFVEETIEEGKYKIGATEEYLENNIRYFDPDDSDFAGEPESELYVGVYACDVLSNAIEGEIDITVFDRVNKTISGTFEGTLFRWINLDPDEKKTIQVTNGVFTLPYTEEVSELDPNRDQVSAKVDRYRFVSHDPSPGGFRKTSRGVDFIEIWGHDSNFGRMRLAIPSDVESENQYIYRPDRSVESLGVGFVNRIDISESLLYNNPNQSNTSHISIIHHDPDTDSIEGTFYIENSEIEGRTITDGYFKITYTDRID